MRKIIFCLFFFLVFGCYSLYSQTSIYYVDPVNGNDTLPGTIDKPFKTISKALNSTAAGTTLYLRGGSYSQSSKLSLSKKGTSDNYIKIWAYPGEKPVIDFTGNTSDGFSISGSYYHLKGIEEKNAGHNGINISGNNNIIENCIIHDNKNTGLHLTGSTAPGPSNNLILNCDSYNNFDPPAGGNADGFSTKWTVGPGNVFRGCRSYNNSDDGWDLWMGTGSVTIDSCYAFRNGLDIWHTGQVDGNGNGFKLGGNYIATPHLVKNCVSFDNGGNTGRGFDENNNTAGQTLYNCTAFRNKKSNYYFNNNPLTSGNHTIKNCISLQPGQADAIKNAVLDKNSWQGFTVTTADFLSIDTTGVTAARDINGRLPKSNFFRLASNSPLIDAGVDVGIPFRGSAPDLGAFEADGTTVVEENHTSPEHFILGQNYPNPFNPVTVISYQLPERAKVVLKIFDLLGDEIATLVNEEMEAGRHETMFYAGNLPSGIYFYTIRAGKYSAANKMVLQK